MNKSLYCVLVTASFATSSATCAAQSSVVHHYFAPFTLTGSTAFAHPFDNDNANNSYLASNAVKYASDSFGGFTFGGMYAFSNGAGRVTQKRAWCRCELWQWAIQCRRRVDAQQRARTDGYGRRRSVSVAGQ
jgi:predicted porin